MKITLCGSRRFWNEFVGYNRELSLAGHVVYSLGAFKTTGEAEMNLSDDEKWTLDLVHLAKIEESDAIFVVGDGYVGDSTKREIKWTRIRGKKVYWAKNYEHLVSLGIRSLQANDYD